MTTNQEPTVNLEPTGQIPIVRAYISVVKKYGRTWFGIRIHWFNGVIFERGWSGAQKTNAQMVALDCLLNAFEASGIDAKLEVIFRREYILHRLGMARTRTVYEQRGLPTRPMKEDGQRWQSVGVRVLASGTRLGMALSEEESRELNLIDRVLDNALFDDRAFRFSAISIEPIIILEVPRPTESGP